MSDQQYCAVCGRSSERYWEGRWRDEKAELDRLRTERDQEAKGATELLHECRRLRAELEGHVTACSEYAKENVSLLADLDTYKRSSLIACDLAKDADDEANRLRRENAELREALQQILEWGNNGYAARDIAKAILAKTAKES